MLHPYYPTLAEVDQWCRDLNTASAQMTISAEILDDTSPNTFTLGIRHHEGHRYVAFTIDGRESFYGLWQPVLSGGPAPLLIHLPGYAAEFSAHPELVAAGYNVLHINPLGYGTPQGPDESKRVDGCWPVLPQTAETFGEHGYRDFLRHALLAVRWGMAQPGVQANRIGVFGTSQGGGSALLLASLLRDLPVRAVAADVPFLTHFPLVEEKENLGAYAIAFQALSRIKDTQFERLPDAWKALGLIDTMNHAHRLTMPTLLTAGELDVATPKDTIAALFARLPGTRSYTELGGQAHGYTAPFLRLAKAWFDIYL